jgi:hypothetical protein
MSLAKSKQRVVDHSEVFTTSWLVEATLAPVKDETERIDSRFLAGVWHRKLLHASHTAQTRRRES